MYVRIWNVIYVRMYVYGMLSMYVRAYVHAYVHVKHTLVQNLHMRAVWSLGHLTTLHACTYIRKSLNT